MDSYQLVLCHKPERVCLHRILPTLIQKAKYLDDWKQHMIWEGGLKLTQLNGILTITFVSKDGKIFASSKLPEKIDQAVEKTKDSSRGYAIRLSRPDGNGYQWIGVAFRDRNDAFDFGVAINDFAEKKTNAKKPKVQNKQIDFSLKQGEKIKVNFDGDKVQKKTKHTDIKDDPFWNFPGANSSTQPVTVQSHIVTGSSASKDDPFAFFSQIEPNKKKVKKQQSDNLLNL